MSIKKGPCSSEVFKTLGNPTIMSEGTHQVSQVLEEKEVCGSFDASSVNVLDASWNALMDIAGAERFKNLSTLSISHNKLKTFSLVGLWL